MTDKKRLDRMENQLIDMRSAVSALLETVTLHQRNFDTLVHEMREIRSDMREMQADI
jgi:hypothetical protein